MQPEVRLHNAHAFPLYVSGVRRWNVAGSSIDSEAFVPDIATRRPIDDTLLGAISADSATAPGSLIEVLPAPAPLLAAGREHHHCQGEEAVKMALGRLVAAGKACGAEYIFEHRSPADRLMATVWPGTNQSPGIHVDNRDNLPLSRRLQSRRRLGMNVGPGSRWLLACFPDLVTMARELDVAPEHVPNNLELQKYMDAYPEQVSCVWIPLPSGWMYKMPSDSMGHDGSTFQHDHPSHMYFFLGHWGRGALL